MFNFFGKKKEENETEAVTEKKQNFFERLKKEQWFALFRFSIIYFLLIL